MNRKLSWLDRIAYLLMFLALVWAAFTLDTGAFK